MLSLLPRLHVPFFFAGDFVSFRHHRSLTLTHRLSIASAADGDDDEQRFVATTGFSVATMV